uniref:Exonuclease domain-containing protein n=1 Tax=Romanomermis culicivorax TaxID=13658 RepID=A0A915KVH7_ROMCU
MNIRQSTNRHRHEYSLELEQVKQKFDYFLIVDFEATCDVRTKVDPQEIIEFPCLKLNTKTLEIDSTFHQFVKPEAHPILTPFCMELTGINQSMIEKQPNFLETLSLFQNWMTREGLVKNTKLEEEAPPYNYAFITCGEWDFKWLLHRLVV